ncbi:hypothetical protein GDO78_018642 [Eleutherodactylus coqui]|uniref:Uncharacterized protein n=1 Tax=Eleutherodactylus coqui TaxID=57060 RepID=A0A8J6B3T8_ELECQ|nr:hypothetical protein GDO78_018642 [Eleutherodactylus coqui]
MPPQHTFGKVYRTYYTALLFYSNGAGFLSRALASDRAAFKAGVECQCSQGESFKLARVQTEAAMMLLLKPSTCHTGKSSRS